jgi:tyrosyl-tRNA synthetase
MASRLAISRLAPSRPLIRPTSLDRQRPLLISFQVRGVSTSHLIQVAAGQQRWKERGDKIQNGELPHVWDLLQERGYIKDVAGYVRMRPVYMDVI